MAKDINKEIESEIDLRKIIIIFYRSRWIIIALSLIGALIAGAIVYFKPNIYRATTTVEIQVKSWFSFGDKDSRTAALSGDMASNLYTELEIIKSRFVTARALKKVDFSHRYYVKKGLKEKELYKKSPFIVNLTKGYGHSFYLIPIDDEHFKLETTILADDKETKFSKVYKYGEHISNSFFDLNITKNSKYPFDSNRYRFVVLNPETLPSQIVHGVSVAPITRKSTVIGVTYYGTVPERIRDFSIALSEVYLEQNIERRTWEAIQTIKLIDEEIRKIKAKIETVTKDIEKFRKKTQTINITDKTERLSNKLSDFESEILTLQLKKHLLKKNIDRIQDGKSLETLTLAGIGLEDDSIFELLKEFRELMSKKRELTRNYTSHHPLIKKVNYKIQTMSKIIEEAMNNIYTGIVEREKFINNQIAIIKKKLDKLPELERKYLTLDRRFKTSETFYEFLLEKRTEAEIRKNSNMNLNRIIDTALPPSNPISPKRKIYIFIGLFIGLFIGVIIAFIRYILDDKLKTEDELKSMSSVPILGTVPHFHIAKGEQHKLIIDNDPKSIASEAFRSIRTNISFMSSVNRGLVIAVTSTIQGEGKTLISTNLASIIGLTNKKVILLSVDMRRPTLHKTFNLDSHTIGMSNILSAHTAIEDAIIKTEYENLDIIVSGPKPPNPSELIGSDIFVSLLETLKKRYDVILMDTPPVGPVTDSKLILPHSDIVIYILRAGYSRKNFVEIMDEIYEERNEHGMGCILNDFDVKEHGYGYKYGYGYGYAARYKYYYNEDENKNFFERLFKRKKKKHHKKRK